MCSEWITTHTHALHSPGFQKGNGSGVDHERQEKDSRKGDQGQRVKVMARGGDSSKGQNNLEGESMRPTIPHLGKHGN